MVSVHSLTCRRRGVSIGLTVLLAAAAGCSEATRKGEEPAQGGSAAHDSSQDARASTRAEGATRATQPVLVAALHVKALQEGSAPREQRRQGNDWILQQTRALGFEPRFEGPPLWQVLPQDEFEIYMTQRECVRCRLVEREDNGRAVVEVAVQGATGDIAAPLQRVTLDPRADHERVVRASYFPGLDDGVFVALRLGREGAPPPPIFARLFLAYRDSDPPEPAESGVDRRIAKCIQRWGFRISVAGGWQRLTVDNACMGESDRDGVVLGRILRREASQRTVLEVSLPGTMDRHGHPVRRSMGVAPIGPGNESASNLTRLTNHADDPNLIVVCRIGQPDQETSEHEDP